MPFRLRPPPLLPAIVAALVGVAAGLGAFAFGYGEGVAYFRDDPAVCANCHIMRPQYDSWAASSHAPVAVCNDCHLPDPPVPRYVSKADNGLMHSVAFTLQNFPEPIRIKPRNRRIVQRSCVACHTDMVHELLPETVTGEAMPCFHCHAAVGHAAAR